MRIRGLPTYSLSLALALATALVAGRLVVPVAADVMVGEDSQDGMEVEICLAVPMFVQPTTERGGVLMGDEEWTYSSDGLHAARGMLMAVEHVNSVQCEILGPSCSGLLDTGGGRRLRLRPYLYNLANPGAGASVGVVQACSATNAEVIAAAFNSHQAHTVANFVGGQGHLLISSASPSPALSDKAHPNFMRTAPNLGENMKAAVRFARRMGWYKIAVLHNQDMYGNSLAEALIAEARHLRSVDVASISLGNTLSDGEVEFAGSQLAQSGHKVVMLATLAHDVLRILRIMKRVVADARQDYSAYTWIYPSGDTMDVMGTIPAAERARDPSISNLFEGLLGVRLRMSQPKTAELQAALRNQTADTFWEHLELSMPQAVTSRHSQSSQTGVPEALKNKTSAFEDFWSRNSAEPTDLLRASYDAIWAAAIGLATVATAGPDGDDDIPYGANVAALVRSQGVPVFQGAAGRRAFLPNGNWDLTHAHVEITNYGTPGVGQQARHATIASVNLLTYEVTLLEDNPAVWANGKVYPYVPSDGTARRTRLPLLALIICVLSAVTLAVLTVTLGCRNKSLLHRMDKMKALQTHDLDLESPLAKMLDFLKRYQTDKRSPSKAEASELEDTIIRHSGALTVPNLETLDESYELAGIKGFLQANMQRSESGVGGAGSGSQNLDESSLLRPDSTRGFLLAAGMEDGTRSGSNSCSSAKSPFGSQSDVPFEDSASFDAAELFNGAVDKLTTADFFIDLVTPSSPFRHCATPLTAVVLRSVDVLGLLRSGRGRDRLLRFTARVEEGYPDTLYHCKLHGADVTNRLMTMLHHSGLAALSSSPNLPVRKSSKQEPSQSVGLIAMVAAMVHDYGHPHLSNAFMVEQQNEMALEFNHQAVAEHFALRETMKLMMDEELDFLDNTKLRGANRRKVPGGVDALRASFTTRRTAFRHMVIQLVLATDMSRHFELLSQFETQVVGKRELRGKNTEEMWKSMTDNQRLLVLQIALKVADIGHCALPMDSHLEWVGRLEEEFFLQGDREKAAGMIVSPLMDRDLPGARSPVNQVGFFKVIVLPLFKAWTAVFPACMPLLRQVEANLEYYKRQVEPPVRCTPVSRMGSVTSCSVGNSHRIQSRVVSDDLEAAVAKI